MDFEPDALLAGGDRGGSAGAVGPGRGTDLSIPDESGARPGRSPRGLTPATPGRSLCVRPWARRPDVGLGPRSDRNPGPQPYPCHGPGGGLSVVDRRPLRSSGDGSPGLCRPDRGDKSTFGPAPAGHALASSEIGRFCSRRRLTRLLQRRNFNPALTPHVVQNRLGDLHVVVSGWISCGYPVHVGDGVRRGPASRRGGF
jgi:hypothetical protein